MICKGFFDDYEGHRHVFGIYEFKSNEFTSEHMDEMIELAKTTYVSKIIMDKCFNGSSIKPFTVEAQFEGGRIVTYSRMVERWAEGMTAEEIQKMNDFSQPKSFNI